MQTIIPVYVFRLLAHRHVTCQAQGHVCGVICHWRYAELAVKPIVTHHIGLHNNLLWNVRSIASILKSFQQSSDRWRQVPLYCTKDPIQEILSTTLSHGWHKIYNTFSLIRTESTWCIYVCVILLCRSVNIMERMIGFADDTHTNKAGYPIDWRVSILIQCEIHRIYLVQWALF